MPATGPRPSSVPAPVLSADWSRDRAARVCDAIESVDTEPVTAESAPRLVHEWLVVEPPQLVEMAAGRRVGSRLAAQVAHRVERLRHLDDHVAGADLQAAVRRELAATVALVRDASYAVPRRRLTTGRRPGHAVHEPALAASVGQSVLAASSAVTAAVAASSRCGGGDERPRGSRLSITAG